MPGKVILTTNLGDTMKDERKRGRKILKIADYVKRGIYKNIKERIGNKSQLSKDHTVILIRIIRIIIIITHITV